VRPRKLVSYSVGRIGDESSSAKTQRDGDAAAQSFSWYDINDGNDMTDYLKIAQRALAEYRAERPSPFPHCPRCASYALYRKNNTGLYECMTCGEQGISDDAARRYG
jgi:hypothetical protein